jgi:hypothetical protein
MDPFSFVKGADRNGQSPSDYSVLQLVSLRLVRHAYASRGVLAYVLSIILCTFVYKIISNLYYLNKIASNTPPPYRSRLYKMRTPL